MLGIKYTNTTSCKIDGWLKSTLIGVKDIPVHEGEVGGLEKKETFDVEENREPGKEVVMRPENPQKV